MVNQGWKDRPFLKSLALASCGPEFEDAGLRPGQDLTSRPSDLAFKGQKRPKWAWPWPWPFHPWVKHFYPIRILPFPNSDLRHTYASVVYENIQRTNGLMSLSKGLKTTTKNNWKWPRFFQEECSIVSLTVEKFGDRLLINHVIFTKR